MRKYKIFIIEDDADEQLYIKESFIQSDRFELLEMAASGEALLEWLKKYPSSFPDVILSDLNMPGMNGYDIITEIKANPDYAHIPVIIISTSSLQRNINKCLALGAADYLVKPETFVDYTPFIENLYKVIDEKQLVK